MQQEQAMEILKMGHNVYLTGQPGSGKTFLLNKYIDFLKDNEVEVGVTASTGIAATHLNGITIHSWSGIGVNEELTEREFRKILKKKFLRKRIRKAKVLIIDEISMLSAKQLDTIDELIRSFKSNHFEPFGGMQVVLSGDFFQLPPVGKEVEFATRADVWDQLELKVCYLTEQWRQSDDRYLKILNDIRSDSVDTETKKILKSRYKSEVEGDLNPTNLYTHNVDVDQENEEKLAEINNKPRYFSMKSEGTKPLVNTLKKGCLAPSELALKEEAPVMFTKNNFDKGYVNGTLGEVVGFEESKPVVRLQSGKSVTVKRKKWRVEQRGKTKAEISQYPLRLAWAITVHKSQGMSLSAAKIDLSRSFEPGMGYVALSRVRSLDGIKLMGLNETALKINPEVLDFNQEFKRKSKQVKKEMKEMPDEKINQQQESFLSSVKDKRDYSVEKIREEHVNAYKEWSKLDEKSLIKYYEEGKRVKDMARLLGRTEEEVEEHLEELD